MVDNGRGAGYHRPVGGLGRNRLTHLFLTEMPVPPGNRILQSCAGSLGRLEPALFHLPDEPLGRIARKDFLKGQNRIRHGRNCLFIIRARPAFLRTVTGGKFRQTSLVVQKVLDSLIDGNHDDRYPTLFKRLLKSPLNAFGLDFPVPWSAITLCHGHDINPRQIQPRNIRRVLQNSKGFEDPVFFISKGYNHQMEIMLNRRPDRLGRVLKGTISFVASILVRNGSQRSISRVC